MATDPPPPRHERGRPRDGAIDAAIIDACVALLGEEGRERLSRARIARRAGVSLPAMNRRYASLDEVLLAVASTPPSDPSAASHPAPDSLRSHLVAHLTRMSCAFGGGSVRRAAVELLAAAAGDDRIDLAFRAALDATRAPGRAWVEHARASGELRADVDAETFLDLVDGAAYYRLIWRGEALTAEDVEPLVDLLLAGAAG